jgi:hypothetical protein
LNEGADVGALGGFPCISVTPLCEITKKKSHPFGKRLASANSPRSQGSPSMKPDLKIQSKGKPINETGFENPE